ncbi:VOC family protein [Amycolatopsis aidingensis]|uniref:VOC family protein n=1 Tax=Amycolatopsis aidingensis TaxID=2842453 RepID=UPI001C0C91E9|nr:VOC family protein [Amycolatopsis aidingensis]
MALGFQVTFDAANPGKLAEFWALALGYQVQPPPEGFDSWEAFAESAGIPRERWGDYSAVVDPDGNGPRLFFHRVPEGKTAKNRVHLDVNASLPDLHTERGWQRVLEHVRTLTEAGASTIREVNEPGGRCMVMRDPEGNEFCVQ